MRKFCSVLILSLSFSGVMAHADTTSCGLPDGYDSESYVEVTGSEKSIEKAIQLTEIEAIQVLVAARHQVKSNRDKVVINSTKQAIKYLKDASEGGDLYVKQETANGKTYSVVLHWPGGNPVGVIFELNTSKIVGYIEDSTVNCK